MSEETVVRWGIGYAPATGDELLKHLVSLGYSEEQALGAGIANRPEFGEVRDMLRGRLTFALRDSNGDVVAFAGRSLDGANPKYLNTPQTSLFDKSSMLYGLDRARDAIAREGVAVVVEGYMDVITAHEHGYQNVVASMGTALTENQVAQLRARAPRVVLALDADAAGQQAMLHSLRTSWQLMGGEMQEARGRTRSDMKLRSADLDALRIALIVDGKDPDELIRNDASKWRDLVSEAIPVVDFLLKAETERIDIGTSEGKAEAVELLMPVIFAIPNWVEQDRYFQKLAGLLQVPIATLEASVGRKSTVAKPRKQSQGQPVRDKAAAVFRAADHDVLDEHAIALLAQYPEILARVGDMSLELMKRPDNRALLSAIQETGTIEGAHVLLESADSTRLDRLAAKALPTADRKQRTADWEACLRRMNERYLRELKAQEEIALADQADDASPADSGYIDAVHKQAIETNERLRDLFVSGPSAS
jgi:DNA primase